MGMYTVPLGELLQTGFNIWDENNPYPLFSESYRAILNNKIIEHYYFREIGQETPALFKFYLNRKMREIMPFYNQLYKSTEFEFEPFITEDIRKEYTRVNSQEKERENTENTTTNRDVNSLTDSTVVNTGMLSKTDNQDTYTEDTNTTTQTGSINDAGIINNTDITSDTPQSLINDNDFNNGFYASTASKNNGSSSSTRTFNNYETIIKNINDFDGEVTSIQNISNDDTAHAVNINSEDSTINKKQNENENHEENEIYDEHITAKKGNQSEMLLAYRETLINIDMQIIEELNGLFFGLWLS